MTPFSFSAFFKRNGLHPVQCPGAGPAGGLLHPGREAFQGVLKAGSNKSAHLVEADATKIVYLQDQKLTLKNFSKNGWKISKYRPNAPPGL